MDDAGEGVETGVFFGPNDYFVRFANVFEVFTDFLCEDFFGNEFGGGAEAFDDFDKDAVLFGKVFVDFDAFFRFTLVGEEEKEFVVGEDFGFCFALAGFVGDFESYFVFAGVFVGVENFGALVFVAVAKIPFVGSFELRVWDEGFGGVEDLAFLGFDFGFGGDDGF